MKSGTIVVLLAGLLSSIVYAQLPAYNGEYGVGYVTVEVPVSNPRSIAPQRVLNTSLAAFTLETVLFNIYYPADKNNQSTKASPRWITNLDLIAGGIAAGSNGTVDASLIKLGLGALAGNAVIPAYVDVPIAGLSAYPIFVFSHGDTSLPEWYSHYLGSIAADGNIVVAITHRDGSNAGSQVIIKGEQGVRNVTYLTPDMLVPIVNATGLAVIERQFRQAEVEEVVRVLKEINDGRGDGVYQNNSRGDGSDFTSWAGLFDLNNLVLGGHSFGATSALDSIQAGTVSQTPVRAGLLLDPGKQSGPLSTNIKTPILIANSEAWTAEPADLYGQDYFTVVRGIAETSLNASNAGWFVTLLGTAHVSITDAGLIAGKSLLTLFDAAAANVTLEPLVSIDRNIDASVEFFRFLKNDTVGGVLALNITDPEYTARAANSSKPDDVGTQWEVHVAPATNGTHLLPSGTIPTSPSGSGSGGPSSGASSIPSPGSSGTARSGAMHGVGASMLTVLLMCSAVLVLS